MSGKAQPEPSPFRQDGGTCYLLLNIPGPGGFSSGKPEVIAGEVKLANGAGRALGFRVRVARVAWQEGDSMLRYFFWFPRYRRDDSKAQRISECLLYALALVHGPVEPEDESALVLPVPAAVLRGAETIEGEKLLEVVPDGPLGKPGPFQLTDLTDERKVVEEWPLGNDAALFWKRILRSTFGWPHDYFDAAWKIAPVLMADEKLYSAVRFLKASQDDFYVYPGGVVEVLGTPEVSPATGFEQSRLENALQNAFKAIEALLGDLPRDDNKLFAKMTSIGLDPQEEVGHARDLGQHGTRLYEFLRKMNKARDQRAAHGSTTDRKITVFEMLDYQACARFVVWSAVERELGGPIMQP